MTANTRPRARTEFTTNQLAHLLVKHRGKKPRKDMKSWLRDVGGSGSSEELDRALAAALGDPRAAAAADKLEHDRLEALKRVPQPGLGGLAAMLADIQSEMTRQEISQVELARRIDVQQPLISDYLHGRRVPGAEVLARIAEALGKRWRLQ